MTRRTWISKGSLTVYLSAMLFILVTSVFLVAFAVSSRSTDEKAQPVSRAAYATEVAEALVGASAAMAEALLLEHNCNVCHVLGDGRVAPLFAGIAERAASRRPHLSAQEYLYESIVFPGVYLVDGYANAMPGNFVERLSSSEIGHIIAHLLTRTDQAQS